MVVVSTNGRQDTEESVVLGMDFSSSDRVCTVGLVLPLWSDTLIHLDGDGGFSVSTVNRVHVFKPVSVQAMWAALQSLHKACEVARCHNYYPGSLFLTWVSYYHSRVASDQVCINEWNAMQDVQSHRADSPVLFADVPTERERTERLIKMRLREIMMQMDLENVTSKQIRTELEMQMTCNLREFKEFIDNEMIVILGQMDSPTEIFDHVFLGSEWNASNLEELQNSGVRYILNVTREIDNFFPGLFEYHNIRVYDEEATNLLEYWNDTFKFISKAKKAGAKCLVHCKMGVSRSASTVIAYAMKEYGWDLERAFDYVKERRAVTKPNPSFMKQLEEYQGILLASKQRHNKLWRSHSDGDLSEPLVKSQHHALDHSDPLNNNGPASLQHFLGMAVLQALGAEPQPQQEQLADRDGVRTRSPSPPTSNGLCDSEEHLATSSSVSSSTSHPVSWDCRRTASRPGLSPPAPQGPVSAAGPARNCRNSHRTSKSRSTAQLHQTTARERVLLSPKMAVALSVTSTRITACRSGTWSRSWSPSPTSTSPTSSNQHHATPSSHPYTALTVPPSCPPRPLHLPLLSNLPPPPTPTRNWATGSVRRVRKQLEQRLRQQELDCPVPACAPAPVPSSPPPTSCSPQPAPSSSSSSSSSSSLGPEHCTASPQPGAAALDEACTEPEEAHCSDAAPVEEQDERLPLDLESGALPEPPLIPSPPPPPLSSFPACPESGTHTHLPTPPALESGVQPGLLWLEGVTEMETDTDGPSSVPAQAPRPYSRLARSSEDLEKIQQTLRELQAFLYEAGGARGPEAEPGQGSSEQEEERPTQQQGEELGSAPTKMDSRSSEARGPAVWQRAMEIEARIRQAGLTPPSLMKRSASLAKLDCLELSTHDLSSWDFHAGACPAPSSDSHLQQQLSPQVPSPSLSSSPVHPVHDDAYKKQRVLHQSPPSNPRPGLCVQEDVGRTAVSPSGPPSPHPCSQHRSKGRPSAPDHGHSHPQPSLHGKPHPLRRLRKAADKKRTVTVLYNTM
ncbi:hypothetical protein AALO_G00203020 [Alosa alosa]|uniref:protein-serine/threonine phosphatase n=1 Tax=Alosa alosa TaxID=278164 RepID=A0AAV6G326_9TELE|nr:hypothetical protein AALO_G00203020 [Alosa alosa]